MKAHAAFLYLAASIAFAGAHAGALTRTNTPSKEPKNSAQSVTPVFQASPSDGSAGSRTAPHLFPVNDERGLLLTCVAPEIDTNKETDRFNDCTLAPGRTLDDVMHTFVRAIHYEQHQQELKDRAESHRDSEEKTAQQGAQ